jgi:hypothetical protein
MTNQVAPKNKHQAQSSTKNSQRQEPSKAREQNNKPNQKDASDLPSGWAFAT